MDDAVFINDGSFVIFGVEGRSYEEVSLGGVFRSLLHGVEDSCGFEG
jgi:hypothetical protein